MGFIKRILIVLATLFLLPEESAADTAMEHFHIFLEKEGESLNALIAELDRMETDLQSGSVQVKLYEDILGKDPENVDNMFALANIYMKMKRQKEAVALYKHALNLDPLRQDIRSSLALYYYKQNDLASSEELYKVILAKDENNKDALGFLGKIAAKQKRYSQAEKYFYKALNNDPNNVSLLLNLGLVLMHQNLDEEARAEFEMALALSPGNEKAIKGLKALDAKFFKKANLLVQEKKYDEAEAIYESLVASSPDEADYLFALGKIHMRKGSTHDAIELYKRALDLDPERQDIRVELGLGYFKNNDLESSKEVFRSVLDKEPGNIDAKLILGQLEVKDNHWKEAEDYFEAALGTDPTNVSAEVNLASIHVLQNQNAKAEEILNRIDELESSYGRLLKKSAAEHEENLLEWGKTLLKQGYYKDAALIFERLVILSPKNVDYYILLGSAYARRGCFSRAVDVLTLGLELKPCNTEIRNALAYAYLRLGTYSKRIWVHQQWFWNYPYMFYFVKEDIYPRENKCDVRMSQVLFEDVLEQNPDDAGALAGLGRTKLILEDNKEEAEALYVHSLSVEPENTNTLAYYAALLASEGRSFSSRNMYQLLMRLDPGDQDTRKDYINVVNESDLNVGVAGFYSQENEQDLITPIKKAWTVRLFDYGGIYSCSFGLWDRLKIFGLAIDENIVLENLLNNTKIYSVATQRASIGFSWNATPYLSVLGGLGFTYFSQYQNAAFSTKPGWYLQPELNITYQRNHHRAFVETTFDAAFVARNFSNNTSALVDRQYLRAFYEYDFGNRILLGAQAANVWYINRIKKNQQQLGSLWVQLAPPWYWENIVVRYQFIYGRFNSITSDYYTYRFQTTHWTTLALSKSFWDNKLITEAGYGHAWQRGFENGQIITVVPVAAFQIVNREINAVYGRIEFNPCENIKFITTANYTRDSFNYTTASVMGKFNWRF